MTGRTYSATILALGGAILMALGLYFLFVRPPLLPEDLRFMETSLSDVQQNMPGLLIWLRRVFWVMGGYMFATGLLTVFVAVTTFRTRTRGVVVIVALSGLPSIGLMAVLSWHWPCIQGNGATHEQKLLFSTHASVTRRSHRPRFVASWKLTVQWRQSGFPSRKIEARWTRLIIWPAS